jgi:hypothetical protein
MVQKGLGQPWVRAGGRVGSFHMRLAQKMALPPPRGPYTLLFLMLPGAA